MELEDKTLTCCDCRQEFAHSVQDQLRYSERGLQHEPKRCPTCRAKRRDERAAAEAAAEAAKRAAAAAIIVGESPSPRPPRGQKPPAGNRHAGHRGEKGGPPGARPPLESFEVVCAQCGARTTVPFKPNGTRPVYCRYCYRLRKDS